MDRAKVKAIRVSIEKALACIEEEHDVKVNVGGASYSNANCTFKVEFSDVTEDGEVRSKESENFKNYANQFGLKADDLNREFVSRGEKFKIVGLSPRSHKYPILALQIGSGKTYKLDAETVKMCLANRNNKL